MTISVTMRQTRRGEDGQLWQAGQTYPASDGFAAMLISSNLATGTLPKQPNTLQVKVDANGNTYAVGPSGDAIGIGAPILITGVPAVGNTLAASIAAGWQNAGGNWTRNGANIAGATALTYPVVSADDDKDLTYKSSNIPYIPPAVRIGAAAPVPVAPGAPTIGTATAGNGVVNVVFTPPASTGGSPILEYQAELSNSNSAMGSGSPIPVSSANGAAVTGRVRARNAVDWGPWSANSNSVTPSAGATVPGAPTGVSATAGDASASVTATAPSSTGGAALDRWRMIPYVGSTAGTPVEGPTLPILVQSLVNGQAVTFTSQVRNTAGLWSVESAASAAVTPQAAGPAAMRLTNLNNLTESGSAGAGWNYKATSGADYSGYGASTVCIPAGKEGYFELRQPSAAVSIAVLALKTTSAAQTIANFAYACQPLLPGQGSQRYIQFSNGGAGAAPNGATVLTAVNQWYRVGTRINGANLDGYIEVTSDNGATFALVHTWANIPKVDYYCGVATGSSANNATNLRQLGGIEWADAKLIFDGNSLFASHPTTASQRVPQLVHAAAPVNGVAGFAMLAIGGQTTQQMIDSAADVDAAIDPAKLNILLAWEGTNGMIDGAEVQAERMRVYLAARKAAAVAKGARLLMIVAGTIPRHEATSISIAERNDRMVAYNQILAANWQAWGCSAYVDTRPAGGPFDLPDWSTASFTRAETLPMWSPDDPANVYTHLSAAGALYIQALFSAALRRI